MGHARLTTIYHISPKKGISIRNWKIRKKKSMMSSLLLFLLLWSPDTSHFPVRLQFDHRLIGTKPMRSFQPWWRFDGPDWTQLFQYSCRWFDIITIFLLHLLGWIALAQILGGVLGTFVTAFPQHSWRYLSKVNSCDYKPAPSVILFGSFRYSSMYLFLKE